MKTKLQQLNLTYVRYIDGIEWLFIPSKDKEWETSHNGCYCLSDKIRHEHYFEPYFNPKSGHVTSDSDIDLIRPAKTYEIDSFIDAMDFFNYTINENNKLEKLNNMSTKNYENKNFKYVRDCDNDEWIFLDSDSDKEYLTSHNGSCCISDEDVLPLPYFTIKTTHIMEDDEVDCIRDATPKEIEKMLEIARLNGYEFDEVTQKFKKIN